MITCRDLIGRALRKINALPSGEGIPADQADDCMLALQGLYDEWVASGAFGRLNDVTVTDATYTALEQDRIRVNNPAGVTVTLPDSVQDNFPAVSILGMWPSVLPWAGMSDYGAIFSSTPRPPLDLTCIRITDQLGSFAATYLYDAANANWVRIDNLDLNTEAPLGSRWAEGLSAALAERMADQFGAQVSPQLARSSASFRYALTHRYESTRRSLSVPYL